MLDLLFNYQRFYKICLYIKILLVNLTISLQPTVLKLIFFFKPKKKMIFFKPKKKKGYNRGQTVAITIGPLGWAEMGPDLTWCC